MASKLTPEKEAQIVTLRATGSSQVEIAEQVGCAQSSVSTVTRREEIRKLIEKVREDFILELSEQAKDNIKEILYSKDKEDKPLRYKYSARVLEALGALPSHSTAIVVQQAQIEQDNNGQKIISQFGEYLKAKMQKVLDESDRKEDDSANGDPEAGES